jgi:F0F1-type ATP synthase delta subunit
LHDIYHSIPIREFELSEKEHQAAEEFMKKLPKKYKYKKVELIFSRDSGIGVGITIRVGDREKDITDYATW